MNHTNVLKNMSEFYDRLLTSSIKFIWIARGGTWMSQEAAILNLNHTEYFVRKNESALHREAFYYVYSKSGVMFLLSAYKVQSEPVLLYNHSILKKSPNATAHQGDHLTFGLSKLASMVHTKVSTHRTRYEHDPVNPNLIHADHDSYCNFSFIESQLKTFRVFQHQECFKTSTTIMNVHTQNDQHLIHKLCKEAMTPKKLKPTPTTGGAKRFFGEYKGVNYQSVAFTDYLWKSLKLERLHTLTDFFMIYDEHENNNPHMIAVLEFESHVYYLYIHTRRVMKAAYAASKTDGCTKQENACLQKMNASFEAALLKAGL